MKSRRPFVEIPIFLYIPQLIAHGKSYRLALVAKAVKTESPHLVGFSAGFTGRQPD
jgi:hypothetical protein